MSEPPIAAHEPTAWPPGSTLAGRYRVVRLLAVGGMAAVYEVVHDLTGRRHALKLLLGEPARDPTAVARFHQEARAATAVRTPHVVEVTDMGALDDGTPFLVMEYLEGEDLGARLQRCGRLPPGEACDVALQVCEGLLAVHAAGIVHRDLKPENIFLSRAGGREDYVKLLDFGVAKLRQSADAIRDRLTKADRPIGTPEYMSPEQTRGHRALDHRTDVYALGVILYEMLAGVRPFESESFTDLVIKIGTETAQPLGTLVPELPGRLVAAVEAMMARDPAARPADCREAARLLAPFGPPASSAWLGEAIATAPVAPPAPATAESSAAPSTALPPGVSRRWRAGALGLTAATLAAWFALRPGPAAPTAPPPGARVTPAGLAPATAPPGEPVAPREPAAADRAIDAGSPLEPAARADSHHHHHHHGDGSPPHSAARGFKLSPFRR